jgi:lantibiotic modifying enzyme
VRWQTPHAFATSPEGVLYRPEDFEPLTEEEWDDAGAREAIREIVAETDASFRGPKLLWRADDWDRWKSTSPLKDLYVGAAGVLWVLGALERRGHAESRLDLADVALRTLERFRARPDLMRIELPEPAVSSLLAGETGILLVAWQLQPSAELADTLLERVRLNVTNEADEVMWGTPGTLLAAEAMLAWTNDERWRLAWQESADVLGSRREADGLWRQRLHGYESRYLGPVHGLVGNVRALSALVPDGERARLERETAAVLERTAVVEDDLVNWPPDDRPELASRDGSIRLQWCHGAPGIVSTAAGYLPEPLVLGAANLIWRAGAHGPGKGSSICHGTAGNGYALLAAFARTGDEQWLERARKFAVHALARLRRERAERGRGRHSLFTGDLGVALFVADCLEARAAFPIFDLAAP